MVNIMEVKIKVLVRAARKKKGLSIEELSKLSGVSIAHISDVENQKSIPTLQILCQLAVALDIPAHKLYTYHI